MYMPKARGYQYIVAARDDLSRAAEGRALKKISAAKIASFFWEQILCRYGAIGEVVTDNGPEVRGAFEELVRRYGIPHIKISPYNSKANGVVERGHFIIREAIIKSCRGNISKWPEKVHAAFFADRVTTSRSTGFSPFYLLHGVHPVLPLDLTEVTFMVQGFYANMKLEELLALRIRQLEKHEEDIEQAAAELVRRRFKSKEDFEKRYHFRLRNQVFNPGQLVLVRNTQVEKELDRKTKPRYLGPFVVVRRTKGGSYVLREPTRDQILLRQGIAAFRLLPYITRNEKTLRAILEGETIESGSNEDLDD